MKLNAITLENFGPFYHKHSLALQVTPSAPVVIVHGENMRGKTSLLNAIRWCLYGSAHGRGGRAKESYRLISYDALDDGDFHMSVTLEFEHEGHEYTLERHVQSRSRPQSDADLTPTVHLRRDGHFVPQGEVQEVVRDILHEDISRFFLFDGEMLDEFEVLLFTAGRASDLVKQSIEQILGLPALQHAVRDLEALHRTAESRQLRAVQQKRKNEALVAKAQQVQSDIDAIDKDLEALRGRRTSLDASRSQLAERRDEFAEIQADVRELEQLEEACEDIKNKVTAETEACQVLLSEAWWEPAARQAVALVATAEADLQRVSNALADWAAGRQRIRALRELLERGACPVCGSLPPRDKLETLEKEAKRLETDTTASGNGSPSELGALQARISQLRPFTSQERLRVLAEKEKNMKRQEIDLHKAERQAELIRARIKGHDRSEIQKIETEYERAVAQLSKLKENIEEREGELEVQANNLTRLQQEIARLPEADPRITMEAGVYAAARDTFRRAIDDFRERLRKDVEREATEIFKTLTTEPQYAGLKINEQYGLSIVDDNGRAIHDRSAGAEQIVALSLIGALDRCATREGPVVMDTPFGRLDVVHREKVLKFVPQLAPQVILLVQSGEFDRKRDVQFLQGRIAFEYRIVRDGRPTKSRFEPVR